MPSPSKNKGSGFEREIAKYLTETLGGTFIRAPGSGAYTGGSNSHRKQVLQGGQIRSFKGDVMPPEEYGLLNIEAKFYADFPFHQLLDRCSQLESWLDQLLTASDPGDINVLYMKFNRKGRYIAVESHHPWTVVDNHIQYSSSKHGSWFIFNLEKFYELNKEIFKNLCGTKPNTSVDIKVSNN